MSETQSTAVDLTDWAARAQRDQLAGRTDVLDKVGALATLPDDTHATTAMVASFYEVSGEVGSRSVAAGCHAGWSRCREYRIVELRRGNGAWR